MAEEATGGDGLDRRWRGLCSSGSDRCKKQGRARTSAAHRLPKGHRRDGRQTRTEDTLREVTGTGLTKPGSSPSTGNQTNPGQGLAT